MKISESTFQSKIKSSQKTLVEFGADWCGPCKMLEPTLNEMHQDGYSVYTINVDESPELSAQYGVRSVPTMIVFENGKEVNRVVGVQMKSTLVNLLQ